MKKIYTQNVETFIDFNNGHKIFIPQELRLFDLNQIAICLYFVFNGKKIPIYDDIELCINEIEGSYVQLSQYCLMFYESEIPKTKKVDIFIDYYY